MVSGRGEWIREPLQHADIRVKYAAGLAMQQLGCAVHGGAECDADSLVPQADPQQWGAHRGASMHQADRRTRAFRGARPRAEQNTVELRGNSGLIG